MPVFPLPCVDVYDDDSGSPCVDSDPVVSVPVLPNTLLVFGIITLLPPVEPPISDGRFECRDLVPFAVDFYVDRIAGVSPSRESDSGINSVHLSSFLSNSPTVCQTGLPAIFVVGRVSLADLGFASLGVLADSLLIQLIKLKLTHVLGPLIEVVRNLEGVVTIGSHVRATDTNLHVHLFSSYRNGLAGGFNRYRIALRSAFTLSLRCPNTFRLHGVQSRP